MADTWAVPGYGVPAYDQTEMDRIRMMQQLLMRQQTQNVAPPMPAQPDVSMPQPDTGRNDPVLDANQNVLMRDAMMQQRQQAAPAPAPVSPQQAPVRMPQPETGDRRAAIGASLTPQQQALVTPAPQTQQTPDGPAPGAMPVGVISPQTPDGPAPGAMPVKRTPFMGEGDQNQAQSAPGEMNIVPKAMENVTQEPQGFLAKAQSWLDKVGSVFDIQTKGQDPNAINPAYGVPNAMVWNAQRNALFNAGIVLMAAGMPNTPQGRAQIIQQLGPALSNVTKDIYNMAQSRLMNAKANNPNAGKVTYGPVQYDEATGRSYQMGSDGKMYFPGAEPPRTVYFEEKVKNWLNPDPAKGGLIQANNSVQAVRALDEMLFLMEDGVFQGATSGFQQNVANLAAAVDSATGSNLLDDYTEQKLNNTQVLEAYVMNVVLPRMSQLGGSDSNEELRKIETSIRNKTFTIEAAKEIISNAAKIERDRYNSLLSERKSLPTAIMRDGESMPRALPEPLVQYSDTRSRAERKANPGGETSQGGEIKPDTSWKQVRNPKTGETGFRDLKSGKIYVLKNGKWEPLANGK